MQIFNLYLVSVHNLYSFHLPFQNQSELEGVDVVNLLDLDDVDHRHRDIDVHLDDDDDLDDIDDDDDAVDHPHRHINVYRDVDVLFFVKAERGDLLVVIVLYIKQKLCL